MGWWGDNYASATGDRWGYRFTFSVVKDDGVSYRSIATGVM